MSAGIICTGVNNAGDIHQSTLIDESCARLCGTLLLNLVEAVLTG